jgi:S-adenosylhomocysteine hydrolase
MAHRSWGSANASTTGPGPDRRDVVLLEGRNAVIYGAIGGAVARAFAREGARVFLAGRTRPA